MNAAERLAALTAVKAEVDAAITAAKVEVLESMSEGDRHVARLDDVEYGQVAVTRGKFETRVDNERDLLAWVEENVPDRMVDGVELTPEARSAALLAAFEGAKWGGQEEKLKRTRTVDPAFRTELLKDVEAGVLEVPGVTVYRKAGYVRTTQKPEEAARVAELWRTGVLNPFELEAVPDAG